MKRSVELTPLSHDHHQALFAAQQLKRADDPHEAREAFLAFWSSHGRRHFQIEEEVLLPAWIERDPGADPAMAARVSEEHLAIRAELRRLQSGDPSAGGLRRLGELLERHVRFEERELFPLIEGGLDEADRRAVGAELASAEGIASTD
jgi:hypothetical protein